MSALTLHLQSTFYRRQLFPGTSIGQNAILRFVIKHPKNVPYEPRMGALTTQKRHI